MRVIWVLLPFYITINGGALFIEFIIHVAPMPSIIFGTEKVINNTF